MLARVVLAAVALVAPPLAAQEASPYVPLQHWTMPYVEHLIAIGALRDPTPLTRPFKQADLIQALAAVDTLHRGDPVRLAYARHTLHSIFPVFRSLRPCRARRNLGLRVAWECEQCASGLPRFERSSCVAGCHSR